MRLFDMDSKEDYLLDGKYKVATPYASCVDVVKEEAISTLITIKMLFDNRYAREALDIAIEALKDRPKGEWIERHKIINQITFFGENRCSNCEKISFIKSDFCPNCGADMRSGTK